MKVAFLKTHKCASTSIQNILLRFGMKHDLNFVLPISGNYLGKVKKFHRSMLFGTSWEEAKLDYHIFALHTKWDVAEVAKTLNDHGDVAYISILRDPVELFRSMWDYIGHKNQTLESFALSLNDRNQFEPISGQNQMLKDFGMTATEMKNARNIQAKIEEIEDTFDLIMIADGDYFNYSILFMREVLCWNFSDVVNFKLNSKEVTKKSKLSVKARQALQEWLWADYMLYDHFKEKFDQRMASYGRDRLDQEMRVLKSAIAIVRDNCIGGQVPNDNLSMEDRLWGQNMMAYKTKKDANSSCKYFTMRENSFLDELRVIQDRKAREKLSEG